MQAVIQSEIMSVPPYLNEKELKVKEHTKHVVVYVDGVRPCLWTVATNGPIVYPQVTYDYGEPQWNDIDRGKPKNSEKNLSQSHFIHDKSHIDWAGRERRPDRPAINRLNHDTAPI
jgi:hypothetical protein